MKAIAAREKAGSYEITQQRLKVISGGQTGADRAGIDAAKALSIETGGFAPKGWRVSLPDGSEGTDPMLEYMGLIQMRSRAYPPRTRKNVQTADGTVIFGYLESGGAILTIQTANNLKKPIIKNPTPRDLAEWILEHNIRVLNVAGNRESDFNPQIYQRTFDAVYTAIARLQKAGLI